MILETHFRLTLYVLSCFIPDVVHLTGAAATTGPSITAEQYPRRHFQRPQIFFPISDSHTSITTLHVQPNDVEVDKAMPKRFYTRCITLLLCIHVGPSGILCYGTTIRANLLEGVEQSKTGGFFSLWCLFQRKNVGILISTWTSFSN